MITDISTIVWKELKELLFQRGNMRGGWLGLLVFIGVFGILLPLQNGLEWVQSPLSLALWAWVPFLLVTGVVADSFAGERERHTLETLLASRLSDRAILFGKLVAAIAYGWGLTLFSVALSLITVNAAHGQGEIYLFPLGMAVGIIGLSFLVATLASGLGTLISLRASTVRQAQQTLSMAFFVFLVPLFLAPMLPDEWQASAMAWMMGAQANAIILVLGAMLAIADAVLIALAMVRFQRSKLILD